MSTEGGTKAILAALAANLGIAVTKFIAFLLTAASSMLAEAVHSLADSGNQVLLLFGGKRAQRAATPEHPFGFGRERYLYAFIVSIVLFTVGGLFALYEAYHKLHEALDGHGAIEGFWWWVPLVVLVAAIVMESFSLRTAVQQSNLVRGKRSWPQFIRSAKAPELPVILLEDFAALCGLTFALFGVGLTLLTDNGIFDAAGTALIGLLLVSVAFTLAVEMKSLLLGEAAAPDKIRAIRDALIGSEDSSVERIIHMRTMHLGPEELLVAAKLCFVGTDDGREIAIAINDAERRAREATPDLQLVMYLEPDIDLGVKEPASWQRPEADVPE